MKISIDATGLRVKVENGFGIIGISHKESICTWREKGRVYGRGTGMRICVGARANEFFLCLELMM